MGRRTVNVCNIPGCGTLTRDTGRCPTHTRQADKARGTRQARGYGASHDQLRREWAPKVATGTVPCARCGTTINPTEPWHLDHNDTRTGYLGPSCAPCNNAAGGRARHPPRG